MRTTYLRILFLIVTQSALVTEATAETINTDDILRKVTSLYSNCTSYRDHGTSKLESTRDGKVVAVFSTQFTTAFRRDKGFRFAYRQEIGGRGYGPERILLNDGDQTDIVEKDGRISTTNSLDGAVARLTGTSFGTVHAIPSLLMPDNVKGRRLTDIKVLQKPSIENVDKNSCYRLVGNYGPASLILFVTTDSYQIVKTEELTVEQDGAATLNTTTYFPILNESLPKKFLQKSVDEEWKVFDAAKSETNANQN